MSASLLKKISVYANPEIEKFYEEIQEVLPEYVPFCKSLMRLKSVKAEAWVKELGMSCEKAFQFVALEFQNMMLDCIEEMMGYNTLRYAWLVGRRLYTMYGDGAYDPGPDCDIFAEVDWFENEIAPTNLELRTLSLVSFTSYLDGKDFEDMLKEMKASKEVEPLKMDAEDCEMI